MISRTRMTLAGLSVCAFTAGVALVGGAPAHADLTYYISPQTSGIVTEVGLNQGTGMIDVQVRTGGRDRVTGVVVKIPAAGGAWGMRTVNTGGAHCVAGDGPALQYVCRAVDGGLMPGGTYALVLPVARRSGAIVGVSGSVIVLHENDVYGGGDEEITELTDTFPVVDKATGPRSTAEVRAFDMFSEDNPRLDGPLSVTTIVAPTEKISTVVITLPAQAGVKWVLRHVSGGNVACASSPAVGRGQALQIVCSGLGPDGNFPVGITTTNFVVSAGSFASGTGTVGIRRSGAPLSTVDTFAVRTNYAVCC